MPLCVRQAYGSASKCRDLAERLDDMEGMLKQLLVLAKSPPREKAGFTSVKLAHRLLNRARHFADSTAKKRSEPTRLAQSMIQSAQGGRILKKVISMYVQRKQRGQGTSGTLWDDLLGLTAQAVSEKCQA